MEIKSIKGLIKYLEKNCKNDIEELKKYDDMSIFETFDSDTEKVINEFCSTLQLNTSEKIYLYYNAYSNYCNYSKEYILYILVMEYLDYYFTTENFDLTFAMYRKKVVNDEKC